MDDTYGVNCALTNLCKHKLGSDSWDNLLPHVKGLLNFASSSLIHSTMNHSKTDDLKKIVQLYLIYALHTSTDGEAAQNVEHVANTFFYGVPYHKSAEQVFDYVRIKYMQRYICNNIPQYRDNKFTYHNYTEETPNQWCMWHNVDTMVKNISFLQHTLSKQPTTIEQLFAASSLLHKGLSEDYRNVKVYFRTGKGDVKEEDGHIKSDDGAAGGAAGREAVVTVGGVVNELTLSDVQAMMVNLHLSR